MKCTELFEEIMNLYVYETWHFLKKPYKNYTCSILSIFFYLLNFQIIIKQN